MKSKLLLGFLLISIVTSTYDPKKGVEYAYKYYNKINHDCSASRSSCTPYGYYGNSFCKYSHGGGDCANFVSQCLIEGGHPKLKGSPCKSFSCGVQLGSRNLSRCLVQRFKWKRECGKKMPPPNYISIGDVIVYHQTGCEDEKTHSMFVTKAGKEVRVTGHSPEEKDKLYSHITNKPYYEWLHYTG